MRRNLGYVVTRIRGEEMTGNFLKTAIVAAVAMGLLGGTAQAADLLTTEPVEPVITSTQSPWMIRLRAIGVIPDEDATLSAGGAVIPGANVSIDDAVVPELDITYFFSDYFAAELILATAPHTVFGAGTVAGLGALADVWLLPPTLLAQFHLPLSDTFKPYVGAGVNYTIFYAVNNAPGVTVDFENSFGWALQAGLDIMIDQHWGVNFDVKKLFLNTDVTVTTATGVVNADVDIDPWIVGGGIVYRF